MHIKETLSQSLRLLSLLMVALLAGCANPGSGPDGGPYDETPPRIVSMSPALGQRGVKSKKVTIAFDENIRVENAIEKVTVSPPQLLSPEIKVGGKHITVALADSLKNNTTYTIDFSDAIEDNNEGNPLGQFTYYFSTGETLDTMEVSGNVLAAENLEPLKGVLVGLHSDTTDTAFTTKPFDRVARTDGRGFFSIKGIAPGAYRIYALKDVDGDFMLSRGEMLASLKTIVRPSAFPDVRYDTVWRDTIYYDSIKTVHYTHYMPDNLVLLAFQPKNTDRHFLKSQRDVPEYFRFYFTAPSKMVPVLKGINFDADNDLLVQRSPGNDTITYWLKDVGMPAVDSLQMTLTYDAYVDSLEENVVTTSDTLMLVPRQTMARRLKAQAEEMEKFKKQLEKRHKRGDFSQETMPVKHLNVKSSIPTTASPMQNPRLMFDEPIMNIDTAAIHLRRAINDSTLVDAPWEMSPPKEGLLMDFGVIGEWRYGQRYELEVDSAAIQGLSGKVNSRLKYTLRFGQEEDFGALFVSLPGADTTMTVQVLSSDSRVERQQRVNASRRADFFYIKPGKYYLRAFNDRNLNGRWDTGDFFKQQEPEEVFYYPTEIEVRPNWDIEQVWRVKELPLTKQKPASLIKQKADKVKTIRNRNAERERNKR